MSERFTPTVIAPPPNATTPVARPANGSLQLWLRCYAPFQTFGGGYRGDSRVESTDVLRSARIVSILTVDIHRMQPVSLSTACDASEGQGFFPFLLSLSTLLSNERDWSTLTVRGRAKARGSWTWVPVGREGQGFAAVVKVAAGNPLVMPSPDISSLLEHCSVTPSQTARYSCETQRDRRACCTFTGLPAEYTAHSPT